MERSYKDKFNVGTNGMHKLIYEDSSVRVELPAADVRDISIWVSVGKVLKKPSNIEGELSKQQILEVYKRVSAVLRTQGHDGIYTNEYELIEVDFNNINCNYDILDLSEDDI